MQCAQPHCTGLSSELQLLMLSRFSRAIPETTQSTAPSVLRGIQAEGICMSGLTRKTNPLKHSGLDSP